MSVRFGAMIPVVSYRGGNRPDSHPRLSPVDARLAASKIVEKLTKPEWKNKPNVQFHYQQSMWWFDRDFEPAEGLTMAYTLRNGKAPGVYENGQMVVDDVSSIENIFLLTGAEKEAVEESRRQAFVEACLEMAKDNRFLEALQIPSNRVLQKMVANKVLEAQDKTLRHLQTLPSTRVTDTALMKDDAPVDGRCEISLTRLDQLG